MLKLTTDQQSESLPAKAIFLFTFFSQFVAVLYSAWALELPALFQLLYWIAFGWLMWWWLKDDSKRTGVTWPLDTGYFILVAWVVIVPYYLFATRGFKGFIGILSFIAVFFAGWLAAVFVTIILWY